MRDKGIRPVDPKDGRAHGPDVLVDLTPLDTPSRFRGIGRYAAGLARGIAELAAAGGLGLRVEALVRNGLGSGPLTDPAFRYSGNPNLRPSQWQYAKYNIVRRLTMGTLAASTGARLMHLTDPKGTPWDCRVPRIITCHDLIPLILHKQYMGAFPGARFVRRLRDVVRYRSAVRLIAISEATRRDVIELLGIHPARIDVVGHGVDHERFCSRGAAGESAQVKAALAVRDPFLLSVGGGDPRKRLELLIRAFAQSGRARDVQLVIAGALTSHQRRGLAAEAEAAGVCSRVVLAGFVDEGLMPALYRSCLGYVFPSVYEGFGLTVLEAMGCGAPAITTLTTSLCEVAGNASLTVPADDQEALSAAIGKLIDDSNLRQELSARGRAWAAHFTWRRCALQTVACYRRALQETG
ncbi:MAG: glycosyltransferase family 4 protein [Desulfobacterales bacterium]|jgi:glycosyltransferase involved in cell wall biosynthesis|nr:glycosyltransferase family 4 protein [Desulfobacterales bacterium]